jgi:hypothetical protein
MMTDKTRRYLEELLAGTPSPECLKWFRAGCLAWMQSDDEDALLETYLGLPLPGEEDSTMDQLRKMLEAARC